MKQKTNLTIKYDANLLPDIDGGHYWNMFVDVAYSRKIMFD